MTALDYQVLLPFYKANTQDTDTKHDNDIDTLILVLLSDTDTDACFLRKVGAPELPIFFMQNIIKTCYCGMINNNAFIFSTGPSFGNGTVLSKLVLAKDAVNVNGTFPMTPEYLEECQHPEALDPIKVFGSVIICNFSEGFLNGTSTIAGIISTAKALGFEGFILTANPSYGDYIAEPIPFPIPGILISSVADTKVKAEYCIELFYLLDEEVMTLSNVGYPEIL